MKAAIALILGMISFILTTGLQLNILAQIQVQQSLSPQIITIDYTIKILIIALAIISIVFSILYDKSGAYKMKILNKLGRILSIAAILFIFIPMYQLFN